MIRTQISLEPEEVSWLKRQAKNRGTSLAGVIRQLIKNASAKAGNLAKPKTINRHARNKIAARFAFVGCIKEGRERREAGGSGGASSREPGNRRGVAGSPPSNASEPSEPQGC